MLGEFLEGVPKSCHNVTLFCYYQYVKTIFKEKEKKETILNLFGNYEANGNWAIFFGVEV